MVKPSYSLDMNELSFLLTRLSFVDNFESFVVENVSLTAATETEISYNLPNNKVAKFFLPLVSTGNGVIVKGATEWTSRAIFLQNHGPNDVTMTLVILGA